jgi:hypothetical protein
MSSSIELFYNEFRQSVLASAESNLDYVESEFIQAFTQELIEAGVVEGFDEAYYRAPKGMSVDGYYFSEGGSVLDLYISDFSNRLILQTITQSQVMPIFSRLLKFFDQSINSHLFDSLEESSPGYGLSRELFDRKSGIRKVNLFLITERVASDKITSIESETHGNISFTYQLWDVSRLHRLNESKSGREELYINLLDFQSKGLSCLPAHIESSTYGSYLVVMPAIILSELYEKYGARLLEQNVRSFLQARGNVNKGIRATILNDPEMFFAYNNGITATAKEVIVERSQDGIYIQSLKDLQIVNGGQTTASLFHTKRKDKASLEKVFVQMKLSVVDDEKAESIIPKISEYANTQNKVNAADFFSNHPFHIRMEEISRRLWAPAKKGAQRETKWFYERARGQYADAQSKLTQGDKKKFQAMNPKPQMFTKTDLAKFENVWEENPKYVNLGAQKNFAQFAKRIGIEWNKDSDLFNEYFFKRAITRAMLFRSTEKIVSSQHWYSGGYRANIVAYTLALISLVFKEMNVAFDFEGIWKTQVLSDNISNAIAKVAYLVFEDINAPPAGISNISEWCKKDSCWVRIQEQVQNATQIIDQHNLILKSLKDVHDEVKVAKKVRKIDNGIEAQKRVFEIHPTDWSRAKVFGIDKGIVTPKEISLLKLAECIPAKIPTERQSILLLEIIDKLEMNGLMVSAITA